MDAIRIEGLTKKYKDVVAVDNLSLSVQKGELFSLLGVNGAGKLLLLKCCPALHNLQAEMPFLMGKVFVKISLP